jgi:NitT/TauT family transport system substrate-binding protein
MPPSRPWQRLRFLTSWFAQAEHGGFYQAQATGLYARAGLDVAIDMGGPQVNGMQLLSAGAADIIMGYDIQVLKAVEQGLPVVTIAACFQKDLQGLMTHADITDLTQLRDHKVLLATPSHATFWPWLQQRYGFRDDQIMPYTYNLQPFLRDPRTAVQAFLRRTLRGEQAGRQGQFLRPLRSGLSALWRHADHHAGLSGAASRCGGGLPARLHAGVARLSGAARPRQCADPGGQSQMTQDRLDYAVAYLAQNRVLDAGLAPGQGIGSMTSERWQRTRDFLVQGRMLSPGTDWRRAFTTRFTQHAGLHQP